MSHNSKIFLAKYIEKETGIIFQESNLYQLTTRLEEVMKLENLSSIDQLASKFSQPQINPALKQRLLDHATNNETLFFRDPVFFKAIQNFIVKEILPHNPSKLKIWSAAASSGQEALSLAIALSELSAVHSLPPVSITATDLSKKVIAKASSGIYTEFEIMRGLSEERRHKYFVKEGPHWKTKPELLSKITYGINNLINSSVKDVFHLILCRNVLIYQKVEVKKVVVENLYERLDPHGAIILGVGETLLGIKESAKYTMVEDVLFYRKSTAEKRSVA